MNAVAQGMTPYNFKKGIASAPQLLTTNVSFVSLVVVELAPFSEEEDAELEPSSSFSLLAADGDTIPQQFSTILSLNAGLTPSSSKNTLANALPKPDAIPTSFPSTATLTSPLDKQSNFNSVPGVAAPFADAATPSNINFWSVFTDSVSVEVEVVRGMTLSTIADAIFSAETLKFILSRNVICTLSLLPVVEDSESRSVTSASVVLEQVDNNSLRSGVA
eukprot:scaffold4386_cov138-Skeletonema_marinoi.AAC.14